MGDVGRGVCAWNPQVGEAHQWPDIKKGSLQPPWGFMSLIAIPKSPTKEKKKNTADWCRPKADTIKDRHLHCGLSQHLLSPKEMLAGAYLGHRVLLPELFGLKEVFDRRWERRERNENESRVLLPETDGLGFRTALGASETKEPTEDPMQPTKGR